MANLSRTMEPRTFTVTLEKDKETGFWTAQCVELPQAISQGKTEVEARTNIREAIELVIEHLQAKAGVRKGSGKKLIEVVV